MKRIVQTRYEYCTSTCFYYDIVKATGKKKKKTKDKA